MDEKTARFLYKTEIDQIVEMCLPNGTGLMSENRMRYALDLVAQTAFSAGEKYALMSLMTADQVAERLGVSARRLRAIAVERHNRLGTGYQLPNTFQWLFRPCDIKALRPGPVGRPCRKQAE